MHHEENVQYNLAEKFRLPRTGSIDDFRQILGQFFHLNILVLIIYSLWDLNVRIVLVFHMLMKKNVIKHAQLELSQLRIISVSFVVKDIIGMANVV